MQGFICSEIIDFMLCWPCCWLQHQRCWKHDKLRNWAGKVLWGMGRGWGSVDCSSPQALITLDRLNHSQTALQEAILGHSKCKRKWSPLGVFCLLLCPHTPRRIESLFSIGTKGGCTRHRSEHKEIQEGSSGSVQEKSGHKSSVSGLSEAGSCAEFRHKSWTQHSGRRHRTMIQMKYGSSSGEVGAAQEKEEQHRATRNWDSNAEKQEQRWGCRKE